MHPLDKLDSLEAMESAVNEALEAALSGQNFAARYGDGSSRNFRRSSKWVVRIKGVAIDSKPLVAAAYKYQFGHELSQKLHGGSEVLVSALARFGYHLEPRGADSGPVARRPDPWVTSVGEVGSKKDFAKLYGGSTMGGIQPSGQTNNILMYSDPAVGTTHGYNFDGWTSDGETYSYTGEGQYGPQTLQGGNGAILNHRSQGRSLRLFVSDGYVGKTRTKKRIYVGEFVIDESHPYSVEDALDNDRQMRTVYVFHLKPVGEVVRRPQDYSAAPMTPKSDAVAEKVPLENHLVSEFETSGSSAVTAEKREQALVDNFREVLVARGHELSRWKITPRSRRARCTATSLMKQRERYTRPRQSRPVTTSAWDWDRSWTTSATLRWRSRTSHSFYRPSPMRICLTCCNATGWELYGPTRRPVVS